MNKLPVTILIKEHIHKIRKIDAAGVYAYLIYCFQNSGVTSTDIQVVKLIVDRFDIREAKAREILDYLFTLDVGLNEYIVIKK